LGRLILFPPTFMPSVSRHTKALSHTFSVNGLHLASPAYGSGFLSGQQSHCEPVFLPTAGKQSPRIAAFVITLLR
jgi:hypothetical protein